jgi:hypothetical protein
MMLSGSEAVDTLDGKEQRMRTSIGTLLPQHPGTFVIDLTGSLDESNRPLVLRRSDTETAYPVLQALGTVEVGHRNSTWSGIAGPFGRVTSASNHTHIEHVLLNAPSHRHRFQEAAVDTGGDTVVVGSFVPGELPDPSHQFFVDKETVYRFRKAGLDGVKSITIGPGVPERAKTTRIGRGSSFIEFSDDGVLLYIGGEPHKIVKVSSVVEVTAAKDVGNIDETLPKTVVIDNTEEPTR